MLDLSEIMRSWKQVVARVDWQETARGLQLVHALAIDDVVHEGLSLRLTCVRSQPDRLVTCQIEHHVISGRVVPLARIDWRPRAPHNNRGLGPRALRYKLIAGSQHHPFEFNFSLGADRMAHDNLPIAVPLDPDPEDFRALLRVVGECFRINGLEEVPEPPWEPSLPEPI